MQPQWMNVKRILNWSYEQHDSYAPDQLPSGLSNAIFRFVKFLVDLVSLLSFVILRVLSL